MNKIWKVVGLIGLIALAFGTTGAAFAQTESPQPYSNPGHGPVMMDGIDRYGGSMVYGEEGAYHDIMVGSFAEALGLSVSELEARLEGGETMWEIFDENGGTRDEFIVIMEDARSAMLEQALEDGTLSQEQADFMSSRGQASGYGRGYSDCMGNVDGDQQDFQRGSQGRWNAP